MRDSTRCLFNDSFDRFIYADSNSLLGLLCDKYHGEALTTTREAWKSEISIMKQALSAYSGENGQIVFEYDIPRLGNSKNCQCFFGKTARDCLSIMTGRINV